MYGFPFGRQPWPTYSQYGHSLYLVLLSLPASPPLHTHSKGAGALPVSAPHFFREPAFCLSRAPSWVQAGTSVKEEVEQAVRGGGKSRQTSFRQPQAPTLLCHCPLLTSVTNAEKAIHFLTTPHPFREGSCHFSQLTAPFLFLASIPIPAFPWAWRPRARLVSLL